MKPIPLGRSPRAAGRVRDFRSGRDATRPTEVTPVSERAVGGVVPRPAPLHVLMGAMRPFCVKCRVSCSSDTPALAAFQGMTTSRTPSSRRGEHPLFEIVWGWELGEPGRRLLVRRKVPFLGQVFGCRCRGGHVVRLSSPSEHLAQARVSVLEMGWAACRAPLSPTLALKGFVSPRRSLTRPDGFPSVLGV